MTATMVLPRRVILFGLALGLVLISGCELTETRPDEALEPEPVVTEPVEEPTPPPTLQDVILALDAGQVDTAEGQLLDILDRRPNSRLAERLLEQIRSDPEALMGSEFHEITIAEGESLSEIAERELGDALQFFALARYNGIAVPRRLEPGRTLRIPEALKAEPELPVEQEEPVVVPPPDDRDTRDERDERDERLVLAATGFLESERYQQALSLLTPAARAGELEAEGLELLAQAALGRAGELAATDELTPAIALLDATRALMSAADGSALMAERDRLQARALFAEGMERRRADALEEALDLFERAAALDPELAPAQEEASRVREVLILRWHEDALVHYREQRLDAAIELWQAVERLDPGFEPAQRYLARARALRVRLKELD